MSTLTKTEEKILKDIQNGRYRNDYLIYNRKSTDEPNNQKNSITHQKLENARFALKQKLPIAQLSLQGFCKDGVISEKHSAFKEDNDITFSNNGQVQFTIERPKFLQLAQLLSPLYFKGVVCLCWDRISRNKADEVIIRKLMKVGIDFRFVYATYDDSSSGALHMDIDGMFAAHHSRVTSEKVTMTKKNLRAEGVCTFKAPIGYLNLGDMRNKPFDSIRAPLVRQAFELYATGDWSIADLARHLNEQGLTTVPVRRRRTEEEMLADDADEITAIEPVSRPISPNYLHKVLTNKFYIGRIPDNYGNWIASISHEALIEDGLFDKVQEELHRKKVSSYYVEKLEHPYRGLVRCGYSGRVFTPYPKKGIMYYGARCPVGCPHETASFNVNFLEEEVGKLISKLKFTDKELAEIDVRTNTDLAVFEHKRLNALEKNDRRKRKLREDLTYLRTNKLTLLKTGAYSPEDFLEEENKLNSELLSIQDEEQASDISMHEVVKDIVTLSELLKDAEVYYSFAKTNEREEITRIIFSELSLTENTLSYQCKNGFKALESRFTNSCDPTESRTLI